MTPLLSPRKRGERSLPGRKKTDSLVDELVEAGGSLFLRRARELTKIIGAVENGNELDAALAAAFDADFVGGLGESLFGGSVIAAEAGREETEAKRSRSRKTTPLISPRERRETRRGGADWQPGVEDYSGPAIEVDFFRLRSFTMAHVTDAATLQSLKDELQKVLEGGGTFADFRNRAVDLLGEAANDDHLRTVYATNLHTAYNAGKYYEGMDAIEELPFWQYVTAGDNKVRPAHAILDGTVWRKDDPIWDSIYPPNGFNCRCSVSELDDEIVEREQLKVGEPTAFQPDQGFENNAAADPGILEQLARQWQMAERLWTEYELAALEAKTIEADKGLKPLASSVIDADGLLRTIPAGLAAQYGEDGALIEMTLRDPQEIWGWPGKNLFYIASYETPEGVKSVAVEVWGDVQAVHVVEGTADAFRKGMLLKKT